MVTSPRPVRLRIPVFHDPRAFAVAAPSPPALALLVAMLSRQVHRDFGESFRAAMRALSVRASGCVTMSHSFPLPGHVIRIRSVAWALPPTEASDAGAAA